MRRPIRLIVLMLGITASSPVFAQDTKVDPADFEAVTALLKKATTALIQEDANAFTACCDPYVYCFFADGTLVRGKETIGGTLNRFFARRPDDLGIRLDVIPRSYRVLAPDVIVVDWPATINRGGTNVVKVNTFTTLRKTNGEWFVTAYMEQVPDERLRSGPEGP